MGLRKRTVAGLLFLMGCLLVSAYLLLAENGQAATQTACVQGNGRTIGNDPFHCWCIEWAQGHKVCRVIGWSNGWNTGLPPHEYAPQRIGPESPPGAHKARITHKAYWYRTVWTATDGTKIYASCRVARETRCWITRIG